MIVTLPCGASADWDRIPTYNQRTAMTGRFCPYTGDPIDRNALEHYHGTERDLFELGVIFIEAQLNPKPAPAEAPSAKPGVLGRIRDALTGGGEA